MGLLRIEVLMTACHASKTKEAHMHLRQPRASRPFRMSAGSPTRAAGMHWARWLVWGLALCIAMQSSAIAMARAAGPAHFHVQAYGEVHGAPPVLASSGNDASRDPMLDQVRMVLNHHGSGQQAHHHDTPVERHQHNASSNDVVTLDDDAANTDTVKNPAGKRLAADLDTPTLTLGAAMTSFAVTAACPAPPSDFKSHIDDLLERPPR